ncbi:hypothetical protein BGZ81_002827, partial [Podila clonocystis]
YPVAFPNAVLINGLLENPKQKAKFETYIKKTVEVLFNNVTLTNRVLKYHEFILPDLAWDRNITQKSPGINFNWQFKQVTENLWNGVASVTNTGGGAQFGLIEWINRKSAAVAKEFQPTGDAKGSSAGNIAPAKAMAGVALVGSLVALMF